MYLKTPMARPSHRQLQTGVEPPHRQTTQTISATHLDLEPNYAKLHEGLA
jgi:hypothetical protein